MDPRIILLLVSFFVIVSGFMIVYFRFNKNDEMERAEKHKKSL